MFNVMHQFHKSTFLVGKNYVNKPDSDSDSDNLILLVMLRIKARILHHLMIGL